MNPFTGLSLESSCFNHLHKRIDPVSLSIIDRYFGLIPDIAPMFIDKPFEIGSI